MSLRLALALLAATVVASAQAQERASLASTRVTITGEVQHELSLGADDLRAVAKRRGATVLGGYGGVLLTAVLAEADIREDARLALRRTYVIARATDGYPAVFSWGELFNTPVGRGVLVAFERDGQPLRDGEGQIALVSSTDERPGPRHVKWLNRIEVRRVPE
jgi:DMSO/TMAO reductase YedYZ molybdopterin-dependent catalytic subunit